MAFSALTALAQPPPPRPATPADWGSVEKGIFQSRIVGLRMEIPDGFWVASTAEAEMLTNAGADLVKKSEAVDKKLDEALQNSKRLLLFSEKPLGTSQNAAFEIVAVRQAQGVSANMALAASVTALKSTKFELKGTKSPIKVGPNSFASANLELPNGDTLLKHRMFVIMHRGYSVLIGITYSNQEQLTNMEKILSSLLLVK